MLDTFILSFVCNCSCSRYQLVFVRYAYEEFNTLLPKRLHQKVCEGATLFLMVLMQIGGVDGVVGKCIACLSVRSFD